MVTFVCSTRVTLFLFFRNQGRSFRIRREDEVSWIWGAPSVEVFTCSNDLQKAFRIFDGGSLAVAVLIMSEYLP
jgi:hypothetical protein